MWIVPASLLSSSDLLSLGNNLRPPLRRKRQCPNRRANARVIAAVNRSLAALEERVGTLYPCRQMAERLVPVPVSPACS